MALKSTKATQRRCTEKQFKILNQRVSTEKPSVALKNTYFEHSKGLRAEERVKQDLLQRKGRFLQQRLKTPFGEADLLFENPKGEWVLIEVKTLSKWDWVVSRIHPRQLLRLRKILEHLSSRFDKSVSLYAAFVLPDQSIHYVKLEG